MSKKPLNEDLEAMMETEQLPVGKKIKRGKIAHPKK